MDDLKPSVSPSLLRRLVDLSAGAPLHWWRFLLREWSISQGAFIFMLGFFISAVLGVVRQMLFNAQFGVTLEASAYYVAARLPDTIGALIAGGSLTNALIPVLLNVIRSEGEPGGQRLINLVLTTLLTGTTLAVLLAIIAAPWLVSTILAPGLDAATSQLTATLTRILLLELLLGAVSSVAAAVLVSRNQFLLPALALALRNISLIAGILATMRFPTLGIYGPTIGAFGDGVLTFAILAPGLSQGGFRYRPIWAFGDRNLRQVVRLLIPNGLSAGVNYAGSLVDTAFASLINQGSTIPMLSNAFLLIGLPIRLLGMAIGQAVFPRLSAHAAAGAWRQMRRTLFWSLGVAMGAGVVTTVGLLLFGRLTIRLLFEHGAFDAAAGTLTYTLLVAYALALPAYIGTEILSRSLYALYDTLTPLLTNCLQLAGRVLLIVLLLDSVGVLIIPIAFAVTSSVEMVLLGIVLLHRLQRRIRQEQG